MNTAIIPAGGKGVRFSSKFKKQFLLIKNRPLLFWTIDKFVQSDSINIIIVILPESEINNYRKIITDEFESSNILVVTGGKKRQDSVLKGLEACPTNTDYVLVHDGVRPFIKTSEIDNIIGKVAKKKAVIPVTKTKNTIKRVENNKVIKTYDRTKLYNVLTPQAFDYKLLYKLHKKAQKLGKYFTDDAAILEYFGYDVYTVNSSPLNFKITDKNDLKIARIIMKNFRSQ